MSEERAKHARINGQLGGRPAARGERAERFSARITAAERTTIEAVAAKAGQPWSSYMIRLAIAAIRAGIKPHLD